VGRDRRSLGLPRPPATGAVPPDRELAYAELHRRATALLDAGKLREAKLAVDSARREFPDAPGVEVLACELDLRQGRPRPAEKACTRALGAMPDLPRAHYLLGHLRLQTNARQAAIEELRRCIELDPRESAAWQTLAEVYRVSGKRQELASLRVEFQKVFARPLR
jgi:predicted Zn-dependent protease